MKYLVDGHNAMHRLGIEAPDHEGRRRELLLRVKAVEVAATVYFDARGAAAGLPRKASIHGIEVRFCREREADRDILARVRESDRPGALTVVSDDHEVRFGARQLGAAGISVQEFFSGPDQAEDARPEKPEEAGGFKPGDFGLPTFVNLDHPPRDLEEE